MQTTNPVPSRQNCCAILVTYHPDAVFFERLNTITQTFSAVVIIDNGSDEAFQHALHRIETPAINIIQNTCNLGLAKALNQGLERAIQNQFKWVITFDQDTIIYPELLQTLISQYQVLSEKPAMLGCNYWHEVLNKPFFLPKKNAPYIQRKTLITSGTLLSLQLPAKIGFFREDYFIDSIDHEYSLRARRHGYKIMLSPQILMRHSIGKTATHSRLALLRIPEHTALRKYYITRNCLTTAATYFQQEPLWSIKQLLRLGIEILAVLAYEQQKRHKFTAICLGVWHAIIGQLGELKHPLPQWRL